MKTVYTVLGWKVKEFKTSDEAFAQCFAWNQIAGHVLYKVA